MTGAFSPVIILSCRIQHIFDKNPVSSCRIIYQHMSKIMIPTRFEGFLHTECVEFTCVISINPLQ